MKKYLLSLFFLGVFQVNAQQIALLKYNGGGDWYANPTALPNLIAFCNENINTSINPEPATVKPASPEIFQYPFIHMTGHGNVVFNQEEMENLRDYLFSGGFLHIDDNYGMDKFIRPRLKKMFPEKKLIELPADHPVFSTAYTFESGLPKIHEHDKKRPQAFGIFHNGRMILLYTHESDLGDGWEDQAVHNDPKAVRMEALKMGANIVKFVFSG